MVLKKKSSPSGFWGYLMLILLLALALITILKNLSPNPETPALVVQKNPLPNNWGALDFVHPRSSAEKKSAAVAVVYNEILSRIETLLKIPTTLPHGTVVIDSAEYLKQVYGSAESVPVDVYRIACLKIYNERWDLKDQYKGKSKDFEPILYSVIDEYYYQGKPPASIAISSVEDYHRAHQKKKTSSRQKKAGVDKNPGLLLEDKKITLF